MDQGTRHGPGQNTLARSQGFTTRSSSKYDRREDETAVMDMIYDAVAEVYAEIVEEDMFYGLWRRRSLQIETNVALSFEQNGMWNKAQMIHAQRKVRTGAIPSVQSEYRLWEDHWMLAAE